MLPAQVRDHGREVGRVGEDVRPKTARAARRELEHRPVPEDRLVALGPEHEPRPAAPLAAVARADPPSPSHAEVASEDKPAFEGQKEVLADRVNRF